MKYVVCNADESEPGTIKDRFIMQHLPNLVIEGMILAGLVTGAQKGILYIRHEYEAQEHILHEEIEQLLRTGHSGRERAGFWLGRSISSCSSAPADIFAVKRAR